MRKIKANGGRATVGLALCTCCLAAGCGLLFVKNTFWIVVLFVIWLASFAAIWHLEDQAEEGA